MQDILYQYLILHRQISLPGIGTIALQKKSSQLDFGNKVITPASYIFFINNSKDSPTKKFFGWVSSRLNISDWDAIRMVNDFSFDLKNKISSGEALWEHVGILRRDEKGNIFLDAAEIQLESEMPVQAEKVLRVNAGHTVRVGEMEKTSVEMEEFFSETAETKDYGWVIAIVITVLSVMFVGWYLSEKGVNPGAVGNQSVIHSR